MATLTDVYSNALSALTGARTLMLSPQWQAKVSDAQRPAAGQALVDVQQAILALSNASLGDIADAMQKNVTDLTNQTNALNAEVAKAYEVQGVINAVTGIIGTVAKIVPLL